jgi:hypothetical protein
MPFRCRRAFPRELKCLLDLLWSVLQGPSVSVTALTAVRNRDQSLFSNCFLLTGGDEEARSVRADHEMSFPGDLDSRSFSSPSEAFVI